MREKLPGHGRVALVAVIGSVVGVLTIGVLEWDLLTVILVLMWIGLIIAFI